MKAAWLDLPEVGIFHPTLMKHPGQGCAPYQTFYF